MESTRKQERSPRPWLLLIAVVCLFALFLVPARAAAAPQICVYVAEPSKASVTGHAFIQLLPDSGPQAGSKKLVYGFSTRNSAVWRALGGYGEVQDDSAHAWSWKICYATAVAQYDRVATKIRQDTAKPPDYHLFNFNCTDWVLGLVRVGDLPFPPIPRTANRVEELLKAFGGVSQLAPSAITSLASLVTKLFNPKIELSDPVTVAAVLARIGAGMTYSGGLVTKNTAGTSPSDRRGAPAGGGDADRFDIDAPARIGQLALDDPERLADGFGIELRRLAPEPRRLGVDDQLTIDFDSIERDNSMVAVDWDDGAVGFEPPTAAHAYGEPGIYRPRAAVLRGATLVHLRLRVEVRRRGAGEELSVDVPRAPRPEADTDEPEPPVPVELAP
jgi:hypothetical protein